VAYKNRLPPFLKIRVIQVGIFVGAENVGTQQEENDMPKIQNRSNWLVKGTETRRN
jgi:hypothetical protein